MQSKGNVIRGHEIYSPAHTPAYAWEMIKEWAGRHITREGIFDAALAVGIFGSTGFLIVILHKVFQNYAVTGF